MLALRLRIAAATLGLGAMAFSALVEARGFGGFHGGGPGFRNPVVFMHPGSFRSPFPNHRLFLPPSRFRGTVRNRFCRPHLHRFGLRFCLRNNPG